MGYGNGMKQLNPCGDALILSLLGKYCPAPGAVLDAGCGRGDRLSALHAALPGSGLWGIDRDGENAALAAGVCPAAEIAVGDVCALPWQAGHFDAALCECTLSLTSSPETALAELHRVLRPDGVLLLGDLCAERRAAAPIELGCGTVKTLFSREWLENAVARAGFRIREHRDCRDALLTMAAQMIFDGSFDACIDAGAAKALKEYRAGYGLWVLEKEATS